MLEYEAELRFVVSDPLQLARRLTASAASLMGEVRICDDWFVPSYITTRSQHETWLASGSAVPIRIRAIEGGGHIVSQIQVKRPIRTTKFDLCKEVSVAVGDPHAAGLLLEEMGLRRVIRLRKTRKSYRSNKACECHVDRYDDGVTILEVEAIVEGPEGSIPVEVMKLAQELSTGISSQIHTSSAIYFIDRSLGRLAL